MIYKFRCECKIDFDRLLEVLPEPPIEWTAKKIKNLPDLVVKIDVNLFLAELRNCMRKVEDGHVMVETVMPIEEYTGERRYNC